MRHVPALASLGLFLGVLLGAHGCFSDPSTNDEDGSCPVGEEGCMCLPNATCFGALSCVQGICLVDTGETVGDGDGDPGDGDGDPGDGDPGDGDGDPGDGDGDPGDGDGDGDGDPNELVVLDMYSDACVASNFWTLVESGVENATDCDVGNSEKGGEMLRYLDLQLGPIAVSRVLGLTPAGPIDGEVRGHYNLSGLQNPSTLEFRAEVALRCVEGDPDCSGEFQIAVAEDTRNGLYATIDTYNLVSNAPPIMVSRQLSELLTLTEPTVVLVAVQTNVDQAAPELLIINPRLVLVDP